MHVATVRPCRPEASSPKTRTGTRGRVMNLSYYETLSVEELWEIHESIGVLLAAKLATQVSKLDRRVSRLKGHFVREVPQPQYRQYGKAPPKYQNPDDPSQTWSGRGKTPLWINRMLGAGKSMDDLRIRKA